MANGRRFRVLNIVDDVTRECLAAIPDTSISGMRVARELNPRWRILQGQVTDYRVEMCGRSAKSSPIKPISTVVP